MTRLHHDKQWWKHAVVYQIYPASFYDSNGDGIGDIPGIISKLDYLASLGIDVIWIGPVYDSPQIDMGYDISNYEQIYAPYGTLQDVETLISETHSRGMRILMDLVINHTSDQHIWFKESRSGKNNLKRDWYIWRPAKYSLAGERLPPNNWRCSFGGGSAWEWDDQTEEYYLHIWAKEQPDLNWENPEARKAIYASAMKFWLDRGIDGFRVDTVNLYSKPVGFPNAPITDSKADFQPAAALYCNGPDIHLYIKEMNDILTQYGAITVGELLDTPNPVDILPYISAQARQLNMVFHFAAVEVGWGRTHKYETTVKNYTLPQFKEALGTAQQLLHGTDAWTTVFLENHDLSRSVSRLTDDRPEYRTIGAKLLALLQCCLSGTQFIYQGQEIGAVNASRDSYPIEDYLDISSRSFIQMIRDRFGYANEEEMEKAYAVLQHLARDHSRIPMAWDGSRNGGFSARTEKAGISIEDPWMKPHPLSNEINVAAQLDDTNSVLAFWRKMIGFRKDNQNLLVYGDYDCLDLDDPEIYTFTKTTQDGKQQALVVLNFTMEAKPWSLKDNSGIHWTADNLAPVISTYSKIGAMLAPFEGRVYMYHAET